MLNKSDAQIVLEWLTEAFAAAPDKTPAQLAAFCKATPQAVNGWLKTGRIKKQNLAKATVFFGSEPVFSASRLILREPSARYDNWPFRSVTAAEIEALPAIQLKRLEKVMRDRLDEWLEDASGKRRSAT
jgi:hypothetical protein